jgi:NTP pyrophosphatase (non-canonical NTP hydrolase)
MGMDIAEMQKKISVWSKDNGWWDDLPSEGPELDYYINSKLMMIVTEIAEATEELRHFGGKNLETYFEEKAEGRSKPCGFGVELADAVIRILDLAGMVGINLETLIVMKQKYNDQRPYRHGGKKV